MLDFQLGIGAHAGGVGVSGYKSVVFDIATNWGDSSYLSIRSLEFYLGGELIELSVSDFTVYATTELSATYDADYAFITSLPKTGNIQNNSWFSASTANNSQRLIIVFNEPREFDKIVVNNGHTSGGAVDRGARNVKITATTDSITSTVYGEAVPNGVELNNSEWPQHVAANVVDDQIVWSAS